MEAHAHGGQKSAADVASQNWSMLCWGGRALVGLESARDTGLASCTLTLSTAVLSTPAPHQLSEAPVMQALLCLSSLPSSGGVC